jgi:hypothetical protein
LTGGDEIPGSLMIHGKGWHFNFVIAVWLYDILSDVYF